MPFASSGRRLTRGGLSVLLLLGAACSGPAAPPPTPTAAPSSIVRPNAPPDGLVAVLPNSDLAVGPNRFLVALIDDASRPISDADVTLRFFTLEGDQGTFRSEAPARYIRSGDKGLYAAPARFDQAGRWGVEAIARRGEDVKSVRSEFAVQAQSRTPAIGAAAPRSRTLTATDPAGLDQICTATPHDDMHALTIEQAVTSGKPSVILFGTPAYCTSQTCGPALEVVQAIETKYRDRVNFVHVEIYEGLRPGPFVPAVREWDLPSDPWVFVIDRDGKVSAKFESIISVDDLEPAVTNVAPM